MLCAASRASAPSASNRDSVTRPAGPQMLSTASGRPAGSSTGADTPHADASYSPRHTPKPRSRVSASSARSFFSVVVVVLV